MKVSFNATLDEMAESSVRLLELTGTVRQTLYWRLLMVGMGAALLFAYRRSCDGDLKAGMLAALIGGALAVMAAAANRTALLQAQRHLMEQVYSPKSGFPCEYEFSDEALVIRQGAEELRFRWKSVGAVKETRKFLEIRLDDPRRIALVPWRAFASRAKAKEWSAEVRRRAGLS